MGGQRGPSTADELVALAGARFELGRAEDGEPFAVERDGANVARFFRGGRASLRATLAAAYADAHGRVPSGQALVDALAVLEGRALGTARRRLPLRACPGGDVVIVDVGDEAGRAIMVNAAGWTLVDRSHVTFRRSELTGSLPRPAPGGTLLADLRALLNMDVDDVAIAIAQIIGALLGLPVAIVLLRGPAGVAKTSAARHLARLLDPGPAPVRAVPKDPEAWAVAAAGSMVVVVDNLDTIPGWLSDALCRAVTGEAFLRRALYTDGGISVVSFRRAVILTAIDPGALRGDLADRLAVVELQPIAGRDRLDETTLEERFATAHPRLLGALLDLMAQVLAALPGVELPRMPRMADYARVLAAVDRALGTAGLPRYLAQRGELQREAAEGDRVGASVIAFMADRRSWTGTAGELLDSLTPEHRTREWPATPRGLSAALRRVAHPLLAAGVVVTFGDRGGHSGRRLVHLEVPGSEPTAPSAQPRHGADAQSPASPDVDGDDGDVHADDREPAGEGFVVGLAAGADGADGQSPTTSGRGAASAQTEAVPGPDPQDYIDAARIAAAWGLPVEGDHPRNAREADA